MGINFRTMAMGLAAAGMRPFGMKRVTDDLDRAGAKLAPFKRTRPRLSTLRNKPCPCKSGRKLKRCCLAAAQRRKVAYQGAAFPDGNYVGKRTPKPRPPLKTPRELFAAVVAEFVGGVGR